MKIQVDRLDKGVISVGVKGSIVLCDSKARSSSVVNYFGNFWPLTKCRIGFASLRTGKITDGMPWYSTTLVLDVTPSGTGVCVDFFFPLHFPINSRHITVFLLQVVSSQIGWHFVLYYFVFLYECTDNILNAIFYNLLNLFFLNLGVLQGLYSP